MAIIKLTGYVTENRELKVELPSQIKPGQIEIFVEVAPDEASEREIPPTWTEEEIKEMLVFHPVPAEDIVPGGWEDLGITDSQAWVDEVRRKIAEERGWQAPS